ncbi:hypothetical protein CFC21_014972 [Triticum aestivum]|uniref:Uncharacterized protein n=3 Tax=Triticum TaxID=4564 RepID=A0A9R1NI09_TRITD|nr:uncharacterized protein LOC123187186 [Triticum aestivum]XP_044454910.1 uncharacterized protein LOC123187186 [Triticum aestivum]KAF6998886.1 hypothetical protein CFC21_014972 [Triticum aestivum]VAH25273.1 unnamed protein product [Triticum turgidum subsp. durum]
MSCVVNRIDSTLRRPAKFKKTRVLSDIYSDSYEVDFTSLKPVKTEMIDSEEFALTSPSELKDLRARRKPKNKKAPKTISEESGTKNQSQCGDFGDERSDVEVDLDEPLIALKQNKGKIPPCKANRKMNASSSPHATKPVDTSPKGDEVSPVQTFLFESTLHDPVTVKLETRAVDQEHCTIAIEHNEEIPGEDICCAEMENTVFHTRDHLSVVLHQFPIEDNGCGQQPGSITQAIEQDVSDAEVHLHDNVEQKKMDHNFSSLDPIDEVCNHHKSLDDTSNSDVNKSSAGNELLLSSVNRSCEDQTDNNEYRYPEVVQVNTSESIKPVEESSPIYEFKTYMRRTLVVMQPDSCGSTDKICTSLEEVVQMPVEGQSDSLVCHDVKTKDILLHMNVEQAATGYNFAYDKTLDLAHTAHFDAQDGRLENIVYDALNNHVQRNCFETKTSVVVPDTVVVLSPPTVADVSHDGHILLANMDESSKDMNQLSGTMNVDICRSVNDQESREAYVVQQELSQACVNMGKIGCAISDSSSNLEETQEISAEASISTPSCLGTHAQTRASDFSIDEGSIEVHTPKKLLSKRKTMSPACQEKFCNAWADIDLCGVQRTKRKINLEDQSMLTTDSKLKSRTSISTSKGDVKSTESPSPQMTSPSVLLDTEKAVEFSQRQMHDIENIAANLIRSLKHMRSLVDANLSSESHSLLPSFNTAEMRAASKDALDVERTTRKWLSIMNKDCNRFCKILTLEGKKAVPHPQVPRKRRKITFADEAGGTLCSVKVFSDGQTSPSACQGEL